MKYSKLKDSQGINPFLSVNLSIQNTKFKYFTVNKRNSNIATGLKIFHELEK